MSRRRWVYTEGGRPLAEPIEVTQVWSDAPRQPLRVDVSYMDGIAAPDGTDISSKRRRAEYMRRNNLADASDFTQAWAKAEKERAAYMRAERVDPATRYAVGKADYELSKRRKR